MCLCVASVHSLKRIKHANLLNELNIKEEMLFTLTYFVCFSFYFLSRFIVSTFLMELEVIKWCMTVSIVVVKERSALCECGRELTLINHNLKSGRIQF